MLTLRPSQAHRWAHCAAFPSWESGMPPQVPGDAAREGTCAAWVAECVLLGDATDCNDMIGKTHKNGWLVTEDMAANVQSFVDIIQKRGGEIRSEHQVTFCDNPHIRIVGTLDTSNHVITDKGLLYVDDLKYGYRIVEVRENPQLIIYAAALLMHLPANTVNLVQLSIYQPRAFHHDGPYRKWVVSPEELMEHAQKLVNAAWQCYQPDPVATPGKWCQDCPLAARCSALAHTTYAMIDTITGRKQREMTPEELSKELIFFEDAEAIFKARTKAIKAEAEARVRQTAIPGWRMANQIGHRKFTVEGPMIQLLTGINPYEQKLVTPTELERRGASRVVLDKITMKPNIGHKLVRSDTAEIFNQKEMK